MAHGHTTQPVSSWGAKDVVYGALSVWLAYLVAGGIYRLYFSPISKIPGPKLAALTFWYEFYYEIFPNRFQYMWKIKQLHEQYGPIVRINPIHVHIHDPAFYDTIYSSGAHKRDRCDWWMHSGAKNLAGSMLDTKDHDLHKLRRSAVSKFFSKSSVHALEPMIVTIIDKLLARLKQSKGKVVNLNYAFAAFSLDVVSEYCFGESEGALEKEAYGKEWLDLLHEGMQMRPFGRQFPWFMNFILDLPPNVAEAMSPQIATLNRFSYNLLHKVERILRREDDKDYGHKTVFHEIRDGDILPESEKQPKRLMAEGSIFMAAGTETTARTLAVTTFYLLKNKESGEKLRDELKKVMPEKTSKVPLPELEKLPYLSAVVNEGLRCAHGVSSRQPRIPTTEDLHYKQWIIPRGTPVMESAYLIHTDPDIYPDPFSFKPERWIGNPQLKKFHYPFGGGSRSCLGMNLATSELYLCLAYIFRTLELEIYDTVEERDVLTIHDVFIGMADLKSEGVKVKVIGELDN